MRKLFWIALTALLLAGCAGCDGLSSTAHGACIGSACGPPAVRHCAPFMHRGPVRRFFHHRRPVRRLVGFVLFGPCRGR